MLFIFSRDENDVRQVKRIANFKHYFYIPTEEKENIPDFFAGTVLPSTKKGLFGEELLKLTVNNPMDILTLKSFFFKTYEGDIKYINRYFIDEVKEIPKERLRKCFFDLETAGMPSSQLDNEPITCIGCYDNYTDTYYTFIINGKDSIEQREKHIIYHCIDERSVLNKFMDHVKNLDYDIIIAHNGARFDYPVLIGRILKLGLLDYGRISPLHLMSRNNRFGEWKCKISGRILFDFLGPKTHFGIAGGIRGLLDGKDLTIKDSNGDDRIIRIKRWSLAYLAQFVGMEKGKYSKTETVEEMIVYNKQDVAIMVALDDHFNVTEYYHNMQTLIGCSYENTYFNTLMIDAFLLKRYGHIAFPSRPSKGEEEEDDKIIGATVDTPIQGLYEVLYVVDQTSLYPTNIVSANMSPETKDENGDIDLKNGVKFNSKTIGIIPDAVKFLLEIRLRYKELAKNEPDKHKAQNYKLISDGYKTLLVSFYGALLYKSFRLYDYKVAESIPYFGRVIKEHVRHLVEKYGYKVIAGDTDSSFLAPFRSDAIEIELLVKIINESFKEFSLQYGIKNPIFNIELDKIFRPVIMSDVKKRYAGYVESKGKRIYKCVGFESVRRDTAPITEQMQETVFKMILDGSKRKDIEVYIKQLYKNIEDKKYPIETLMLPKGFSKAFDKFKVESPWIRGAQYSNKYLGTSLDQYSEFGLYYIKSVPEGKQYTNVVCLDIEHINLLDGYIIDWNIQLDKLIGSKIQNIYTMLKWIPSAQKTLLEF